MATGDAGDRREAVCYRVDNRASQFTVQAFAAGLISRIAHSPRIAIRDWTGTAQMNSGRLTGSSLKVRVNPASLEVLDELPDRDRRELHRVMNQEVLETTLYPEILYEGTEINGEKVKDDVYRIQVKGTLGLHGVSNDHGFVAQVAFGADTAHIHGDFTLLQSDYNIRIASIAGGSLKLQDQLKFTFYVVARKVAQAQEAPGSLK
jgi:polyisoprenoid-binding protein YceI